MASVFSFSSAVSGLEIAFPWFMKHLKVIALGLLWGFFLTGCAPQKTEKFLQIKLSFPKYALPNLNHLRSQSDYLKVVFDSKEGWHQELKFPPHFWEELSFSQIDFPRKESDTLWVHVEIWGEGAQKKLFQGVKRITDKEFAQSESKAYDILLHRVH